MTIRQALTQASQAFRAAAIPSANLDAEVLLSLVLGKSRERLSALSPDAKLSTSQQRQLTRLVNRRAAHEPLAYLAGVKEFYSLEFIVSRKVLIPRPETELLVEEVLDRVANRKVRIVNRGSQMASRKLTTKNSKLITICDLGTGSGCIAITLKKQLPSATVYATDISAAALALAQRNANRHGIKVNFYRGDLLTPVAKRQLDVIVANLPYLPEMYLKSKKVRKRESVRGLQYEPKLALTPGRTGTEAFTKLFRQIEDFRLAPSLIVLETGQHQRTALRKLTTHYLPGYTLTFKKDLAGLDRLAILERKNPPKSKTRAGAERALKGATRKTG